jgi:trigger factor
MRVSSVFTAATQAVLTITPSAEELAVLKKQALGSFQAKARIAGFRPGRAPLAMVEKNTDPTALQTKFLEMAISQLYPQAVTAEKLRPVDHPEIAVKRFVPFAELELEAKVTVIGEIKLGDYKSLRAKRQSVSVTAAEVDAVARSLRERLAETTPVERAARLGDRVEVDFKGNDAAGQPVNGAEGKGFPIVLGSNRFIPGFEDNLVGLAAGQNKSFDQKFPKDYDLAALAGKKVTFKVTVVKVWQVKLPPLDDKLAAQVGPFTTLIELIADIKKQLIAEKERQAALDHETALLRELIGKSQIEPPDILIEDQVERLLTDLKRNLTYRSQTYREFLKSQGKTDEQYRQEVLRPQAAEMVKGSLALVEVAEREKIEVRPEELSARLRQLRGQYQDAAMRAELDKPEAKRAVASRLLSEKAVARIVQYNQA